MRFFFLLPIACCSLQLSAITYRDIDAHTRIGIDEHGRTVEETITGNLSGTAQEPESYTIRYSYAESGLLLERQEDNGISTKLNYNHEGELTDICLHHDTYKKRLVFAPSLKQPEMLIEYLYDPETGEEIVTRKVENGYSEEAKLTYQQFFDPSDRLLGQMLYHYDAMGNPAAAYDHEGNGVEQVFDSEGKCLSKRSYAAHKEIDSTVFCYDDSNRPVIEERNNAPVFQEFNDQNLCVAETDALGNRIEYAYDEAGRLTKSLYPAVLDCDDLPYRPSQEWLYNDEGNVCKYIDLRGDTILIDYTSRGQPCKITYSDGSADIFEYNLDGSPKKTPSTSYSLPKNEAPDKDGELQNLVTVTDSLGQAVLQHTSCDEACNTTTMTLDALGRIARIVKKNCFGEVTLDQENRYDGVGNKTCEKQLLRTPDGEEQILVTRWEYGPKGRLERVFEAYGLPEQKVTQYCYDEKGRLSTLIKPSGETLSYTYNENGEISGLASSDNSIDYRIEHENGCIVLVEDRVNGCSSLRNYVSGRLVEETLGNGLELVYSYDEEGRRTGTTLPDQSGFLYEWDEEKLEKIARLKKDGTIRYTHTFSEDRSRDTLAGKYGTLTYSIDEEGRCSEILTPCWAETVPNEAYDETGKLHCSVTSSKNRTESNHYRYDDRCRLIEENDNHYEYDTLSNRYTHSNTQYNPLCQLQTQGDTFYRYDQNGNLIARIDNHGETRFTYDALDRMTGVTTPEGKSYRYTYDYFNRRLSKACYSEGCLLKLERYLYDENREIGMVDEQGRIAELRMLGPGLGAEIGAAVAVELKGKTYIPVHDHRGSVVCLLKKGAVFESYSCNAFGKEEAQTDFLNPWRFSSKRFDPETGFIYFGKRYYDPENGRWTTPDPMGFIEGANRYQFVGSNPVTNIDLYGSFSQTVSWVSAYSYWDSFLTSAGNVFSSADQFVKDYLSYESYIEPTIDEWASTIFGEAMLVIMGYWNDDLDVGIYGKGEMSDNVRVTVINGILNIRTWAENNARLLSKTHGDINVHYIFRPTRGWTQDLVKGTFVKFGYPSEEARLLARTWKQLIQEIGGVNSGGIIVHYAHSIGGADTSIARQFLTPEEQKMIRVISLGSPMIIPHGGFHSVINYMSLRDGIFFLDPLAHLSTLFSHDHNIIYLDTYWGIPIIDHLMNRGSYKTLLETLGQEFKNEFLSSVTGT